MEEKKVYTHKELLELMKKLKKSTKDLTFQTTLHSLFASVQNGKKIEDFTEELENPSILYEGLLESFEEHEKVVAELKEALTSFHLVDNEDVTKE